MPASAAAGGQAATGGGGGGGNPFQLATNLYCEKNNTAVLSSTSLTTSQQQQGGQVNAGQYLRGIRLIVRAQSAILVGAHVRGDGLGLAVEPADAGRPGERGRVARSCT